MTTAPMVLSFFDYTGHAVRPWAEAGYECLCFDIQHPQDNARTEYVGGGSITYLYADLEYNSPDWHRIREMVEGRKIVFVFGFPPCDDLAVSGARHFAGKLRSDPQIQKRATSRAVTVENVADYLGAAYVVENPRSVLSTLWRRPDHKFDPCDYGGYLPDDDVHPRWPDYIAPRDAYTKDTWLWTSANFVMPQKRRVEPEILERTSRSGKVIRGSRQFMKLGGKSLKTKNIRNETPRGFSIACFLANGLHEARTQPHDTV